MPKFPWTKPRSPINRHLQSTYISLFQAHTTRPPLEKGITNPIPRVEFIREFTTRAYYRYIQVAILFAQRARPQRARKQGISFRQCEVYNTYFVCFLLSGPKIGWRTCATSPSPFSPSQTYACKWIRKPDTLCYKNHSYLGNTLLLRIRLYLHTPGKLCTRLDRVYVHRLSVPTLTTVPLQTRL